MAGRASEPKSPSICDKNKYPFPLRILRPEFFSAHLFLDTKYISVFLNSFLLQTLGHVYNTYYVHCIKKSSVYS